MLSFGHGLKPPHWVGLFSFHVLRGRHAARDDRHRVEPCSHTEQRAGMKRGRPPAAAPRRMQLNGNGMPQRKAYVTSTRVEAAAARVMVESRPC